MLFLLIISKLPLESIIVRIFKWSSILYGLSVCLYILQLFLSVYRRIVPDRNRDIERNPLNFGFEIFLDVDLDLEFDENPEAPADVGLGHNDSQNVHDTTVQNYLVSIIAKLKKAMPFNPLTEAEVVDEVVEYIYSKFQGTSKLKDRARSALRKIQTNNVFIHKLNLNELKVLQLVWMRIVSDINKNNAETLKDNLIQQLADCMVNDKSEYCAQGRVARIIQSLEVLDAESIADIKPLWAVKEEIATLFGKYRENMINKLPLKYQQLMQKTELSDKENKAYQEIVEKMAAKIQRRLNKAYVLQGIVKREKLDEITKDYFDALVA